ncbi:MAG: DUF2069 domain-containing protein [Sulfuriflexus sp.]|nr:DUF2069 domain-containing protein [Sulfuriflexus sp.]
MNSRFYYSLALIGYFGLFILLSAWTVYLAPPTIFPISIVLLFYVGPLLIPLRGLLHGKLYTHAWVHFMALFYFIVGVMVAAGNAEERNYALAQVVLSILMFIGSMMYVRVKAREVKQQEQSE